MFSHVCSLLPLIQTSHYRHESSFASIQRLPTGCSLRTKQDQNRSDCSGDTLYSTGDKKLYTAPGPKNAIGEKINSTVYKSAAGLSLCLQLETGRTSVFTIGCDDAAELTFTDGSLLKLWPITNNSSHRSAIDYGCWIFVFYWLTAEAVSRLRAQGIKALTVLASLGRMDYKSKDKQADIIREQVLCFD